MFQYGIPIKRAQEIDSLVYDMQGSLKVGNLLMHNMPGDCGVILLSGCNQATDKDIASMMQIASEAGMSKIIGTICHFNYKKVQEQKNLFVKAGFRVISKGASNRTPEKTHITIFYHNPNPIKKGY